MLSKKVEADKEKKDHTYWLVMYTEKFGIRNLTLYVLKNKGSVQQYIIYFTYRVCVCVCLSVSLQMLYNTLLLLFKLLQSLWKIIWHVVKCLKNSSPLWPIWSVTSVVLLVLCFVVIVWHIIQKTKLVKH